METFGLTVLAKDDMGLHYVNHTVMANSLGEADDVVIQYYRKIKDKLIEFDQAVELEVVFTDLKPRIIET